VNSKPETQQTSGAGTRAGDVGFITIWTEGNRLERSLIIVSLIVMIGVSVSVYLAVFTDHKLGWGLLAGGLLLCWGIIGSSLEQYHKSQIHDRKVAAIENRPQDSQKAWDLARVSLEGYIDQNRSQVRWIFWIVLFIMGVGFAFVGLGVWLVYQSAGSLAPAIVAASSGVISQFIGATFLLIFRSTIAQAREYVLILERINAVGMSINILESMAEPKRDNARSELIHGLLSMYGTSRRAGHSAGDQGNHSPNRRSTKKRSEGNEVDADSHQPR
jgi:hypothetical protein